MLISKTGIVTLVMTTVAKLAAIPSSQDTLTNCPKKKFFDKNVNFPHYKKQMNKRSLKYKNCLITKFLG